jgi:hypothetical protein|tara:strand:- start:55 stop:465 length:411 start_codon:yes stop_codon:yes gene_type:complete
MARPSKIDRFIEVAKDVLFRDGLMLLTDEELVDEINENLDKKDRISQRTFERWKSNNFDENGEIGAEFCRLIKKALRNQKENLFKKFSNDDRAWQRWAWIIERKFSEWNLKNINENKNENTHTGEIKINYNLPNGD